ncbi:hypothetical protein [Cellvibrio sp.]
MFGLAIIFFLLLYLVIWVLVVLLAAYLGWRFTKSKMVMFFVGAIAFLAIYWPAFGDLIPTLRAHKQLCEKEAGLKVYATPEQWDKENPGVLDALHPGMLEASHPNENYIVKENITMSNQRFGIAVSLTPIPDVPVKKLTESVIDVKTGKILFQVIDFSRGYGNLAVGGEKGSFKFWLYSNSCLSELELYKSNEKIVELYRKFNMEN